MPAQPTVYVDFDDVLCETARGLAALAGDLFGLRIRFEDILSFDLERAFGINRPQWVQLMDAAHQPEFLHALEPVPGAAAVLESWRAAGARIAVVTGRPPDTREASALWLDAHGVPCDELVFVDKYGRHGPQDRVGSITLDELRTREFCLAIDDAPEMIRFLSARMSVPLAVFERPWNLAELGADGIGLRDLSWCRTWADIGRLR